MITSEYRNEIISRTRKEVNRCSLGSKKMIRPPSFVGHGFSTSYSLKKFDLANAVGSPSIFRSKISPASFGRRSASPLLFRDTIKFGVRRRWRASSLFLSRNFLSVDSILISQSLGYRRPSGERPPEKHRIERRKEKSSLLSLSSRLARFHLVRVCVHIYP